MASGSRASDAAASDGVHRLGLAGGQVVVAGAGTAGLSAARFLVGIGARVVLADDRFAAAAAGDRFAAAAAGAGVETAGGVAGAAELQSQGARLVAISDLMAEDTWTRETAVVIVSPGFRPTHEVVTAAAAGGVPVWGEVELAWRVDAAGLLGEPRTWLVVTGTNGKTTTTSMLAEIVAASGRAGIACGNIGLPVLDALQMSPRVDVLCAELSSFQLHWAPSVTPAAGVVLNVAEDHLDWHGTFDAYAQAKAGALRGAVAVVGLDDEVAAGLPCAGRRVGFTLTGADASGPDVLTVDDGMLVDRAFGAGALFPAGDVRPAGPSGVADALAAAALALAIGIDATAVAEGLRTFRPAAHRGEVVASRDGIAFVDDSKATNPHAAQAAVAGFDRVVLIAGGLLKGASMDDMLAAVGDRLLGVVAIGQDRQIVVDTIARHAPEVPTVTVFTGDDGGVNVHRSGQVSPDIVSPSTPPPTEPPRPANGAPRNAGTAPVDAAVAVMDRAVAEAWALAAAASPAPDAVLLAPAAASLDMFGGYGRRGDAFAAAARRIAGADDADR